MTELHAGRVRIFVNGQAMSGGSLHGPLAQHGHSLGEARTAPRYRFWACRGEFPALEPLGPADAAAGWSVPGELYLVDYEVLRDLFLPAEPPELELGVVELMDGPGALSMRLRDGIRTDSSQMEEIQPGTGWRKYLAATASAASTRGRGASVGGASGAGAASAAQAADHRGFGSDNQAGIHPRLLAAIAAANSGHVRGYGDDPYTESLGAAIRSRFGEAARVYPVFSGTGANVVALAASAGRWQSVICTDCAHINTDEGAAVEQMTGLKMAAVPAVAGKLTPDDVRRVTAAARSVHQAAPAVLSLTQCTELGTVYTPEETAALARTAHDLGLMVHVDGTRLANACVTLGLPMRALTTDVGVDLVSLGGTKSGMLAGDAVVVLNQSAAPRLEAARKGSAQLGSKLRFISAQLAALLADGTWQEIAANANERARQLSDLLSNTEGVRVLFPVQANSVFVQIPERAAAMLTARYRCQEFPQAAAIRIMCSWDTTAQDVTELATALGKTLADG
jgi:threonine aldolase